MIKRITFACVLSASYQKVEFMGILIALEIVFTVARYVIEKPPTSREVVILMCEEVTMMIGYFILYFTTNSSVVAVIISLYIYLLIMALVSDLLDLYLSSNNSYIENGWLSSLFHSNNAPITANHINYNNAQMINYQSSIKGIDPLESERKLIK